MLGVWHGPSRVGSLTRDGRALCFEYAPAWLAAQDAFPLSPRIPLGPGRICGDEPLAFFSNLLPEGPLLRALCKLKRLPEGDVYAQLDAFGGETAGALALLPEADTPSAASWRYVPYTDAELVADLGALRSGRAPLLGRHGELRLSLAGAQDKLPVHYDNGRLSLPAGGAPSTHILKPSLQPAGEYPDSVRNEALCLALAREAALPAARAEVLERRGEVFLLVERFDRERTAAGWRRLHQLDFCQLAGVLPDQKYEKDGGPGFAKVFALISEVAALPAAARLDALDWMLFNFLTGNADAHAKNLAMIPATPATYRLAPWYDLVATGYYPGVTTRMAMRIGGEDRPEWVRARHWRQFAADVGVNATLLRRRAAALAGVLIGALPAAAKAVGVPARHRLVGHLRRTVETRAGLAQRVGEA
jgi:serine/threonine-protein kinase HipA